MNEQETDLGGKGIQGQDEVLEGIDETSIIAFVHILVSIEI